MDKSETKMDKKLMEVLNKLKEGEEIDVLVYVKQASPGFDEFLQARKEKGELKFNFLEFASCYVVEASRRLLLDIAEREDVSRMAINSRFGVR